MAGETKKKILFVYPEGFPNLRVNKMVAMLESDNSEIFYLSEGSFTFRRFRNSIVFNARSIVWYEGITSKLIKRFKLLFCRNKVEVINHLSKDFAQVLKQIQPDVIHWGGLPKSLAASKLASSLKIHFILDLHENYPYNFWSTGRDLDQYSGLYSLTDWLEYEKLALSASNAVVVTCDEMRSRLIGMHGSNPDKIFVVHNTEFIHDWDDIDFDFIQSKRLKSNTFDLIYGGSCSIHRGLDVAIRGLSLLIAEFPDIRLHIVGEGPGIILWKEISYRAQSL